jgi:type IV secretory pathway TraG/TraD family ATPase VirD4
VLYFGKKTWYKKSSGRTYSKQGSSSLTWDVVGRELATVDELSKLPPGNCILFLAGIGAFYSKLYDLKEHPNYKNLYEPRKRNMEKLYDHKKELQYGENADYKMLCDTGLSFAVPIERLKIEDVNDEELKLLVKNGVIGLNDLKIKIDMQDNQ